MPEVMIRPDDMPLRAWADLALVWEWRWPGTAPSGTIAASGAGRQTELRLRCPLHGGDAQQSLSIRWPDGVWRCFSCGRSGRIDPETLPAVPPVGRSLATQEGRHAGGGAGGAGSVPWRFRSGPVRGDAEVSAYLRGRGLPPELLPLLGPCSVALDGMHPDDAGPRLQVPLWLGPKQDQQCGWAGRLLSDTADGSALRWRLSGGSRGFVAPRIPAGVPLLAVEGPFDVLAMLLLMALPLPPDARPLALPFELQGTTPWPFAVTTTDARAAEAFVRGRTVCLLPDADAAGERHAAAWGDLFRAAGASEVRPLDAGHVLEGCNDPAERWERFAPEWAAHAIRQVGGDCWPVAFLP